MCSGLNESIRRRITTLAVAYLIFSFVNPVGGVRAGERYSRGSFPDSTGVKPAKARNHKRRYFHYGLLAAAGGITFALDKDVNKLMTKPRLHSPFGNRFFDKVEDLGTERPYIAAVPSFVIYGLIAKDEKSLKTGGELAAALLVAQGMTQGFKHAFGRKRPYESSSPGEFFDGGTSFYSGHTISAFTFATVVSKNYPRQDLGFLGIDHEIPLVPVLAYSTAGMVAIQRLYANVHWSSDDYFGALAGYFVGSLAVHFGNKIHIYSIGVSPGETNTVTIGFQF